MARFVVNETSAHRDNLGLVLSGRHLVQGLAARFCARAGKQRKKLELTKYSRQVDSATKATTGT